MCQKIYQTTSITPSYTDTMTIYTRLGNFTSHFHIK